MRSQLQRMAVFGGLLAGAFGSSAPARAPELSVLDRLEKGAWELRGRGAGGPVFNLCLGDPRQLMQVRHHHHRCVQRVVEAKANAVTVHYSCPGAGQGRTTLRIETRELVQMHTQGVAQSAPFSLALRSEEHTSELQSLMRISSAVLCLQKKNNK